jgi:Glycosyl-transferase for dystroglycan
LAMILLLWLWLAKIAYVYNVSSSMPSNRLLNGDFGLGIRYWKPFHWFGAYEIAQELRWLDADPRHAKISIPNDVEQPNRRRTVGLFQLADGDLVDFQSFAFNRDDLLRSEKKIAQNDRNDDDNNVADGGDDDDERESGPDGYGRGRTVALRTCATVRLAQLRAGYFVLMVRGKAKDGLQMKPVEAKLHFTEVMMQGGGQRERGEPTWQSLCVDVALDRPMQYVAVYLLLDAPEGSEVHVASAAAYPLDRDARRAPLLLLQRQRASSSSSGTRELPAAANAQKERDDKAAANDDDAAAAGATAASKLAIVAADDVEWLAHDDYRVHSYFWRASKQRLGPPESLVDVTVATQLTPDRCDALVDMFKMWRGPMSVAFYVTDMRDVLRLEDMRAQVPEMAELVDFHVVYNEEGDGDQSMYPINVLRDIACRHVAAEFVLLLDVDFMPAPGLRDALRPMLTAFKGAGAGMDRNAYVLPAFEVDDLRHMLQMPRSKDDLLRLVGGQRARQIHLKMAPESQAPTDYERWALSADIYQVDYQPHYEPFVVTRTSAAHFDARFKGYGFDKASHAYQLARAGTRFFVLPGQFIVHRDHGVPKWRQSRQEIISTIWMNVYEFVYELESATRRWTDLWRQRFDFIDLQGWDDVVRWEFKHAPSTIFYWSPLRIAFAAVALTLLSLWCFPPTRFVSISSKTK